MVVCARVLRVARTNPIGAAVRQSLWLFPAIETVHLLGMTVLVGTAAAFDLRLLGWALQRTPFRTWPGGCFPGPGWDSGCRS